MDIISISISFIVTVTVTLLYTIFISFEIRHNRRFAPKVRSYLDKKTIVLFKKTAASARYLVRIFQMGGRTIESDLVDPVTEPIVKMGEHYHAIKTGEVKIRKKPFSRMSPYLQYLLKRKR